MLLSAVPSARARLRRAATADERVAALRELTAAVAVNEKSGAAPLAAVAEEAAQCLDGSNTEEVRVAAAESLNVILSTLSETEWASAAVRAVYGWILSQLLDCCVASTIKLRALRMKALQASSTLVTRMASSRRLLACFYPGVASALQKVCCADFKQGAPITVCALELMTSLIVLVFGQNHVAAAKDPFASLREATVQRAEQASLVPVSQNESDNGKRDPPPDFLVDPEDPAWRKTALNNSAAMTDKVVRYLHRTYCEEHDEPAVRIALIKLCGTLLAKCPAVSFPVIRPMVDVLVLYSLDSWPDVASAARGALHQNPELDRPSVTAVVREALQSLVVALPRIVRKSTDSEKLTKLRLVTGYCVFLGPTALPPILAVSVAAIVDSLLETLTIDRKHGALVVVARDVKRNLSTALSKSRLDQDTRPEERLPAPLLFCDGAHVRKAALAVPGILASNARCASLLLDEALDRFDAGDRTAECLLLFSRVVVGYKDGDSEAVFRTAKRLIGAVTALRFADEDEITADGGVARAFACYFIGCVAAHIGQEMKRVMLDALPFLLKGLGSRSDSVSDAAWVALEELALATGEPSVDDLIRNHADYVVDRIVRDLRLESQGALEAVGGVLQHSPTNAVWLLGDILSEVIRSLDESAKAPRQLIVYSAILNRIASALITFADSEAQTREVERLRLAEKRKEDAAKKQQQKLERETAKGKEELNSFDGNDFEVRIQKEGDDDDDGTANGDDDDDFDAKPTATQEIATKIVDRARNFVACRELQVQMNCLDCISNCLKILSRNRRQLLPAIYSVWDVLMKRLESNAPSPSGVGGPAVLAAARVADVVGLTAELGTDFMAGEKFERAWAASARLIRLWSSRNEMEGHKLMGAILKCLCKFAEFVPVGSRLMPDVKKHLQMIAQPSPNADLAKKALEMFEEREFKLKDE